mgnify:CR=1 FL=1
MFGTINITTSDTFNHKVLDFHENWKNNLLSTRILSFYTKQSSSLGERKDLKDLQVNTEYIFSAEERVFFLLFPRISQ